jgi:hypothetical protein
VPGNAMDDVGFLNKNSAVFKSVTVEVAGMKNAKFTQAFFKNIKDNGHDITASMSHAIEPSWRSVFLNAMEVVREAVAEKKVIMMDDAQSNFITSKFLRKEPNQYFDNCAYLTPKLFQTAVDDVFLKKTMTDWLEAEKITADTLLERMQAQFNHGKPFIINYDTRLTPCLQILLSWISLRTALFLPSNTFWNNDREIIACFSRILLRTKLDHARKNDS